MSDLDRQISNWGTINIGPTRNHVRINIEQTVKGARVTATVDREDHEIDKAIEQVVYAYVNAINSLQEQHMQVDESAKV